MKILLNGGQSVNGVKHFMVHGRYELSGQTVTILYRRIACENDLFGRDLYAVSSADLDIPDKAYLAGFLVEQRSISSTGQCARFDSDILGTPFVLGELGFRRIGRFGFSQERSRDFHAIFLVRLFGLLAARINAKTGKEKCQSNC